MTLKGHFEINWPLVESIFWNPSELVISPTFQKVLIMFVTFEKKNGAFVPIISFEVHEMANELIIWGAIWATVLVANWSRTELTRSKCEWTRIWTI